MVQPAAEAKKADWVALLTPRPPDPTGRETCVQAALSLAILMFVISPRSDRRRASKRWRCDDLEQGEVLKV